MTLATTGTPATASSLEAVAGVHLGATHERDVEHDLLHLGRALVRHGVPVTWLTTHRTTTALGASCSAAVTAATDAALLAAYVELVARELDADVTVLGTGHRGDTDADHRATAAAAARAGRGEGRAVWFPGHAEIAEAMTVGELVHTTAIDAVEALGGADAGPDVVVTTRSFLRPRFVAGRLLLHVQPARGGVLVPFETPAPTPCCVDHA